MAARALHDEQLKPGQSGPFKIRKARKYMVVKNFVKFIPNEFDFQIFEEELGKLAAKQFLVKAEYISIDPYLRTYSKSNRVPYEQFGFQVGRVIDSKNDKFPINSYVVSHSGWRDYTVLDGSPDQMFSLPPFVPDLGNLPSYLALGPLGTTGLTAYLGLMEICRPKSGETLCVTSAGGGVGSLVGQIGKVLGCTIVGYTSTDEKVRVLKKELGFHYVFNYKTDDIPETLKLAAPNGIDCFFDNVGGPVSWAIWERMNDYGRIANCGSINVQPQGPAPKQRPKLPVTVQIESFGFAQYSRAKQEAALRQIKSWLLSKTIQSKQTVRNGFEQIPLMFIAMLKGETIGKALVKV